MVSKWTFAGLVACLASLAGAQETRGTIAGRVLDPTAAAVTGCPITVTNNDTGVATRLTTSAVGYYEANLLLPGSYEVAARCEGFKQTLRKGIALQVATRLEVDLYLELGGMTESVSVTAEAPLLDTTTASSGRVVNARSLSDLPILNNMSLLLANLAPGVQTAGVNGWVSYHSGGAGLQYSVNGNVGGNDFAIDGVPNNSARGSAYIPHTESVEEFKLETSGFDASMGHSTGANVAMMTKAGTNSLHGSLTETYWNQKWQAASFFVRQKHYKDIAAAQAAGNTAKAEQIANTPMLQPGFEHNYAATLGGPIVLPKLYNGRNRLFFFFSYNGFTDARAEEASTFNRTVPGLAERNGDFSALLNVDPVRYQIYDPLTVRADANRASHYVRSPLPGNIVPKSRMINPLMSKYTGFYPNPNNSPLTATAEPTNNYLASDMRWDLGYKSVSNRFDYQLNDKHRFFARWNWFHYSEERSDWTYESAPGLTVNAQRRGNLAEMIDWTYTKSASTTFDVAIGNTERIAYFEPNAVTAYKPSDVGLPTYMDQRAGAQHALPMLNVNGYNGMSQGYPARENNRLSTLKGDMFHIRGNHSFRAGADFRSQYRTRYDGGNTSGTFNFDSAYTRKEDDGLTPSGSIGHSWAAFLMGMPSSMSMAYIDSYATANNYLGWYAQDNWRLTPKLSLTLGLRMEYETGGTERFNRALGAFDPTLSLPITTGAQEAYAKAPIAELAASQFKVLGGSTYSGVGDRPRNWWKPELMFMPRAAFAYQAGHGLVIRGGYGMFFDSNNVHNLTPDLTGFSRSTSTTLTTDFGQTWLAGDPVRGISPLADPFPVRADGTRFDDPTKSALGSMAKVARGSWTYLDYNTQHPRQQRWRIGAQKQLGNENLIEAAYTGSYSDRVPVNVTLSALPEQYWAKGQARDNATASNLNANVTNPFNINNFTALKTSNPAIWQDMSTNGFYTSATIAKNKLLRAYPQMNGVVETANVGETKTHALELSYSRRMARGFMVQSAYTRMYGRDRDYFYNEFDATPSWRVSNNSRPHRLTFVGVYELPFGKGRRFLNQGLLSQIVGGWQTSGTWEFQPGPVIEWGNLFYYGSISDIRLSDPTFDQWFNTAGFERTSSKTPAAYQARVFPQRIDDVRADHTNQVNANVQREIVFKERIRLQLRLDALNAFNRSQMNGPTVDPVSSNFGKVTSQSSAQNRFIQIQARIRF